MGGILYEKETGDPDGSIYVGSKPVGLRRLKTDAPAADGTAAGTEAEAAGDGSELVFAWWGNQVRNERTQQMLELYSEQIRA